MQRNNILKATLTMGLAFTLLIAALVLTGCGGGQEIADYYDDPVGAEVAAAEAADPNEPHTVIDHNGNEITIPANIERIVMIQPWPLPSVYALYVGGGDRIVGVHPSVQSAAEFSLLNRVAPEVAAADISFAQAADVNVEELMNLDPCLAFIMAGNDAQREALESAGVPAVAFSVTIADWNTIETVNAWVELLAEIFGDVGKANEITDFGRSTEAMVLERIATLDEDDKPRALILVRYDEHMIQTMGTNQFGQYWLDTAGAINVAGDIEDGFFEVNMEQVLEWDPEIIFITNFSAVLAEDFDDGVVFNDDWSTVTAVQNGEVHKFPMGMYRWYPPSSDSALTLMWLAQTIHPELFDDIDLEQEIRDFYLRFYDLELSDQDLHDMFNPVREAAAGS